MNIEAYEGAWASRPLAQTLELLAPFASVTAGPGAPVSNEPGTLQGRFGWLNSASGIVNNTRIADDDALGVVIPLRSLNGANGGVVGGPRGLAGPRASSTWEYYDPIARAFRIRPGLVVTLMRSGNFWLKFPGGAIVGSPVYASLVDGSAISGAMPNAERTPWLVCSEARPGDLAKVSTTAFFTP